MIGSRKQQFRLILGKLSTHNNADDWTHFKLDVVDFDHSNVRDFIPFFCGCKIKLIRLKLNAKLKAIRSAIAILVKNN